MVQFQVDQCIIYQEDLKEIGLERLGKFLAIMFSICCIGGALGGGNMFQANQSYQQFVGINRRRKFFFLIMLGYMV